MTPLVFLLALGLIQNVYSQAIGVTGCNNLGNAYIPNGLPPNSFIPNCNGNLGLAPNAIGLAPGGCGVALAPNNYGLASNNYGLASNNYGLASNNYGLAPNSCAAPIGYGDVAVTGELPVGGCTTVGGQVPVIGYVTFEGTIPANGLVSVDNGCGCGCGCGGVY